MEASLRKSLVLISLAAGAAVAGPNAVAAADDLLRWQSVIGIIQGNNIVGSGTGSFTGAPGSTLQVKGTLVCDTNGSAGGGNSVHVDTPLVDLDDDGDARFVGNVGAISAACGTEPDVAFLIRTASGRWIANGTVLR